MGEVFGTDPIKLLDVTEDVWAIRVACAIVIAEQRAKEAEEREKARQKQKR